MIRQKLKSRKTGIEENFRLRGLSASRIEAFSDTVFGFAITLLVISLSPPATYNELIGFFRELPGFLISITLLMFIWFEHYKFFLKYALGGTRIIVLNTILLFLTLYFVYPLKFLFSFLTKMIYYNFSMAFTGQSAALLNDLQQNIMPEDKIPELQVIYGIGAASIYIVLALFYKTAYQRKEELRLDKYEAFYTRFSMYQNLMIASVPVLSCIMALTAGKDAALWAGMTYALYGIIFPLFDKIKTVRLRKI